MISQVQLWPTVFFLRNIRYPSRASYKIYEFGKQCPDNGQIEEQFKKSCSIY